MSLLSQTNRYCSADKATANYNGITMSAIVEQSQTSKSGAKLHIK